MYDRWTDRLSEYLDGELDGAERQALEQHLRDCDDCTRVLAELEQVVAIAANAPELPPERDLWAGIAQRIAAPRVVALETHRKPARRISFTLPQLAAAAALVMMLGAGSLYLVMSNTRAPAPVAQREQQPATAPGARLVSTSYDAHESAIEELEEALAQNRARLDTATVRVLEQSIATIDGAITEARAALEQDPGNPFLHRHLDGAMKKKIEILRRAVSVRRAES